MYTKLAVLALLAAVDSVMESALMLWLQLFFGGERDIREIWRDS
jgi:hypothetical protein